MKLGNPAAGINYYETVGNLRSGDRVVRTLLSGTPGAPNNYRMGYGAGEAKGEWTTPRHRHPFEQIRHPIEGDYVIAKNEVLPAGWVAYFPESAYYGPQIKSPNLKMVTIQFGGPSGQGFYTVAQRKQCFEDLVAAGGRFEDGIYSWTDVEGRKHNQDAAEAVWERFTGRPIEYPAGRFRDLVKINPAVFDWIKDKDAPGVARKNLGTFTEREVRVALIRLDRGAVLTFGTEKSPEVLFVKDGALNGQDGLIPRLTAVGSEADEAPVALTATEQSELFYVKLSTF